MSSIIQNRVVTYSNPLSDRNLYLDLAPHVLKLIFEHSSKSQLVHHGWQLRRLIVENPPALDANKYMLFVKYMRQCKQLYYKK